jgi:pyruvate,orthophosphate dikinase
LTIDEQVGICGEHGGEPSSVAFFAEAGLDYVSCSPFRFKDYTFPNSPNYHQNKPNS